MFVALTDGQGVTSMLRRRMCDEKVNVRKAALLALESLIRMNKDNVNEQVSISPALVSKLLEILVKKKTKKKQWQNQ